MTQLITLDDYVEFVGQETVERLRSLAKPLQGLSVIIVSSTRRGGGVAEILQSEVPLLNELGIDTEWHVLNGNDGFFKTTKAFHNTLHGEDYPDIDALIGNYKGFYANGFRQSNEQLLSSLRGAPDIVYVQDTQPLNLIEDNGSKWIVRYHMDLSNPNPKLWQFVDGLATRYDARVVSLEGYTQGDPSNYFVIPPAIDPSSPKNKEMTDEEAEQILGNYGIPTDKPLIAQVSRLDSLKDPVGVIDAFRLVRDNGLDCRLALVYNGSVDDPEGKLMYKITEDAIYNRGNGRYAEDILLIEGDDPLFINAIQRVSKVILQKSKREGFGLTVAEALWKGTPVVGGNVGGIPLQVIHGENGYLVSSVEEAAHYTLELLSHPNEARAMGQAGKEHIQRNFLLPHMMIKELELFHAVSNYR
jgi:trehalose synthase